MIQAKVQATEAKRVAESYKKIADEDILRSLNYAEQTKKC
jgi:hypothetical protein